MRTSHKKSQQQLQRGQAGRRVSFSCCEVLNFCLQAGGGFPPLVNSSAKAGDDISVTGCNGLLAKMIADGTDSGITATLDADDTTKTLQWRGAAGRHWLRFTVVAADGTPLMLSNPVYINF